LRRKVLGDFTRLSLRGKAEDKTVDPVISDAVILGSFERILRKIKYL